MTELADLIARLEKATGPDYRLDVDIAVACPGRWPRRRSTARGKFVQIYEDGRTGVQRAPDYTGSIDSAMRLKPDDNDPSSSNFELALEQYKRRKSYWLAIIGHSEYDAWQGRHKYPAIAICIACLEARAVLTQSP